MNRPISYIGIDNGVSGSLALISGGVVGFVPTPTRTEQSYTKKKAQITRIEYYELHSLLHEWKTKYRNCRAFIERPYVNPKGFKATVSALRSLEATLIAVEILGISYEYIDSRQWQKVMLPSGCKGIELKHVSVDVGIRLFPMYEDEIRKHKDADSLLIAEWARREGL